MKNFLLVIISTLCFSINTWCSNSIEFKKNFIVLYDNFIQKYEYDTEEKQFVPREKYSGRRFKEIIKIDDCFYGISVGSIIKLDNKLKFEKCFRCGLVDDIETDEIVFTQYFKWRDPDNFLVY